MTPADVLGPLAAGIGSVMGLSPLLQARLVVKTGSSRDVSLAAMVIFVVNSAAWIAYGVSIGSTPVVFPNVLALTALSAAIAVVIAHRPGRLGAPRRLARSVVEPARVAAEPAAPVESAGSVGP